MEETVALTQVELDRMEELRAMETLTEEQQTELDGLEEREDA